VGDVPDPDSPAGKAGLQPKDVITAFNGKPVRAAQELTDVVASTPVGQRAKVDFIRNGQPQTVTVELVERPASFADRSSSPEGDEEEQNAPTKQTRLGIQARTVTPELAEQMKPKLRKPSGALVIAVQPNSPAAEGGVLHGDVIHGFDRNEVNSVEDLLEATKSLKVGETYLLEVERKGRPLFLKVIIE